MSRAIVAAAVAMAAAAFAQLYLPGVQVLTFLSDVDDSDQPYALYLPRRMEPGRRWPLVVSLHGAGSNHRMNLRQLFGGSGWRPGEPESGRTQPRFRDVPFIVAAPLARGSMGYQGIAEKDVYDTIADVRARFPVDEDRIYLTGLSMGGGGALWLGLTRPDLWAAVAAVCPSSPTLDGLEGNALNYAVKLFHGDADPAVPVEASRRLNGALRKAGVDVEYVEYPGIRHNAWDVAYRDAAIFDWFAGHRRQRHPRRVRFSTSEYDYRSAWWVTIDALSPGRLASVDAVVGERGIVTVTTDGVEGITLHLASHPALSGSRTLSVTIDGRTLPISRRVPDQSFRRTTAGWVQGPYQRAAGEKRPGLSGPARQAISGRHLYVYGTLGSPTPEELLRRQGQARQAAEWSTARSRLLVDFPVLADSEVQAEHLRNAHLILFGTRQTNSLVARLDLPLELDPSSADYGLVQVVPAGDRLAVVNSGLAWWTRADQATRRGLSGVPAPWRSLSTFGDYILYRGGLDGVVAEGRFDRRWRPTPADAAALARTGVVRVR